MKLVGLKTLEEQLVMFRPEGALTKHDDQIDGLSMINEYAYAPSNMSVKLKRVYWL